MSLRALRRVAAVLDARVEVEIRWRGGEADRLLDARHAALAGEMVKQLRASRWETALEVTYAQFGERGSIDLLAFRPDAGALLVVEVKSELTSIEETLRRLDQKARLGPTIATERLAWDAVGPASRLLVLPESSTSRDRLTMHAATMDSTLPVRGLSLRRWLERPNSPVSGILLLRDSNPGSGMQRGGGSHRVRGPRGSGTRSRMSVTSVSRDQ